MKRTRTLLTFAFLLFSSVVLGDETIQFDTKTGMAKVTTSGVGTALKPFDFTNVFTLGIAGGGGVTDGDKGDIIVSGSGIIWTIDNGVVTLAKLASIATDSIIGRATAGTGAPEVLTALPFALTGDVTTTADSNATTIANNAVTYAKMQDVSAASKLLGRGDSGSGDVQEITLGTNLTMSGTTLNATAGGTGTVTHTTGALTANQLVIGNAADDIKVLGTLGTTTTVLHGNAGGAPTFGAVSLSADVSGDLPFANVAQIATDSILGRATAATGDVEVLTSLPFAFTGDVTRAADSNATVLAAGNAGNLNSGTLLAARMPALTGDVTTTVGTVATTIANDAVTLAKMANMATDSIIGRATAATGDPEVLTTLPFAFTGEVTRPADSNAQTIDKTITPTWTGLHLFNAQLNIGGGAISAGVLRIFEDTDDGTNKASFTVPTLAADTAYTLPPNDGDSGQVLRTDGGGILTWVAQSGGAPTDADYLVGTANGSLSAEIVVGTSPGGELGGSWASPTIDDSVSVATWTMTGAPGLTLANGATSSGVLRIDEDDDDGSNYAEFKVPALGANTVYTLPPNDGTSGDFLRTDGAGVLTWVAGGGGGSVATDTIWDAKGDIAAATGADAAVAVTVGANDTILMADSGQAAGLKWAATATTTEIADVTLTEATGTSDTYARGDHVHAISQAITPTWTGLHLFNAQLNIGGGAISAGVLRIFEDTDDGTNKASFTVPTLAADTAYTLPPDDGDSGEFLRTDGSGNLTWVAPAGGGTVTQIDVDAPLSASPDPITGSGTLSINVSAASKLLGRGSAGGAGVAEEITLGTNLSMSGTTLNATGGGGSQTPWTSEIDADGFSLLMDDGTGIKSSEIGFPELLLFTSVASAVNELTVTNAATGSRPALSATGGDTDIGIAIAPKGLGEVLITTNNASDRNRLRLDNTNGTNKSSNIKFLNNGTGLWEIANDAAQNGGQDFMLYDNVNGRGMAYFSSSRNSLEVNLTQLIGWNQSTAAPWSSTPDTALYRNAAGVVEINNGTAGTYRDLKARNVNVTTGVVLDENASVVLDPAGSADGKYTGTTLTGTGGEAIAFGDLVTIDKDDGQWYKVDISAAAAANGDARGLIAIAVTSSSDNAAITVMLQGVIRADANFPALTIGAAVYASTTGDIIVAQPTTVDHVIRIVGFALTADEIWFSPANMWITHT